MENLSPEEIKDSIVSLAVEHTQLLEDYETLVEILSTYTSLEIETKDLAKEMGLTHGQLNVWLCSGSLPFLRFRRNSGYSIHEYIENRGYARGYSRVTPKGYENYIVWNLKGRMAIHREWKDWLKRYKISDIEKLKR